MKIEQGKNNVMLLALLLAALIGSGKAFVPNLSTLRFNSPLGSASPAETAEKEQGVKAFDDVHEVKVERTYYQMIGMGGMPDEQYTWRENLPGSLVCQKCRIRIKATFSTDAPSEGETSFRWLKDKFMVPINPADLEARCGEVIKFIVGRRYGSPHSIQRSILQERQPNSMLSRLVSETWEENPYSEIPIDGYDYYFGYVLDFIRDGTVCLPASLLKTSFLEDLTY
jgi:hypothetical protein